MGRNCSGVGCTDLDPGGCDGSRMTKSRPGHSGWLGREDKGRRQALKCYLECKSSFPLITWSSLQGGVQLLSLSCVAQESGMTMLRRQALPSVPPFIFCHQRLLCLAQLWRSEQCLLPSQVVPPIHVVLAPGAAWMTIPCSQAQPAQMLSPQECPSCCVLRLFDPLKAEGACRAFPGGSCAHGEHSHIHQLILAARDALCFPVPASWRIVATSLAMTEGKS